jgi:hypothetical protein
VTVLVGILTLLAVVAGVHAARSEVQRRIGMRCYAHEGIQCQKCTADYPVCWVDEDESPWAQEGHIHLCRKHWDQFNRLMQLERQVLGDIR